ncbi:MAG: CPBP family intramembrane metalloprotease [Anaerolineae bacterium]|nr:CPBP family intramembrane metalloprotease [Anaerolineae bacterium]
MRKSLDFIKKSPIVLYCLVLVLATVALALFDFSGINKSSIYISQLAPALTAISVSGILGGRPEVKKLINRLALWHIGLKWYVISAAIPIVMAIANVIYAGFRINAITVITAASLIVGCIGEELGWRGFLLPQLQIRHSPLKSSLVVGIIWEIWHLPLRIVILYTGDVPAFLVEYVVLATATIALSITITSIYNNARESIIPSVLLHSVNNILMCIFIPLQTSLVQTLIFTLTTAVIAGFVVYKYGLSYGVQEPQ